MSADAAAEAGPDDVPSPPVGIAPPAAPSRLRGGVEGRGI